MVRGQKSLDFERFSHSCSSFFAPSLNSSSLCRSRGDTAVHVVGEREGRVDRRFGISGTQARPLASARRFTPAPTSISSILLPDSPPSAHTTLSWIFDTKRVIFRSRCFSVPSSSFFAKSSSDFDKRFQIRAPRASFLNLHTTSSLSHR